MASPQAGFLFFFGFFFRFGGEGGGLGFSVQPQEKNRHNSCTSIMSEEMQAASKLQLLKTCCNEFYPLSLLLSHARR